MSYIPLIPEFILKNLSYKQKVIENPNENKNQESKYTPLAVKPIDFKFNSENIFELDDKIDFDLSQIEYIILNTKKTYKKVKDEVKDEVFLIDGTKFHFLSKIFIVRALLRKALSKFSRIENVYFTF